MKNKKQKENQNHFNFLFLSVVVLGYVVLLFIDVAKTGQAIMVSIRLLLTLIPVFVIVILFMGGLNYFLNPQKVKKLFGKESGLKGWFFAILLGIISHGSIYAWYPLLKDLQAQGMKNGLIAAFLYNRAIKIPHLPVMIYYFGIKFVVILFIYMVISSIIEGLLIDLMQQAVAVE